MLTDSVTWQILTAAARVRAQVYPVGFVVDKVALGQVFSQSPSVFHCQYHSTVDYTFPKIKKKYLIHSFIHSFTHSLIHFQLGTNNRPVKAAAVQ
jgi:hypothetical protein